MIPPRIAGVNATESPYNGRVENLNERNDALRLLSGLDGGSLSTFEAYTLADRIDPVLVYAIVGFLRASYPAAHPAASAVLGRVGELMRKHPHIVRKAQEGERDPISQWLRGEGGFDAYRGRGPAMIEDLCDKLES